MILNPFLETEILLGYNIASNKSMLPPNSMCFGVGGTGFVGRSVMRPDFNRCTLRFLDSSGVVLGTAKSQSVREKRPFQLTNPDSSANSIKNPLADVNSNRVLAGDDSMVVTPNGSDYAQEITPDAGSNVSNRSFVYAAFSSPASDGEHLLPADRIYFDTHGVRVVVETAGSLARFEIVMDGFVRFDIDYYNTITSTEPDHVGSGPYKEVSTVLFTGTAGVSGSDILFPKTNWAIGDVFSIPELIFDLKNKDIGVVHA